MSFSLFWESADCWLLVSASLQLVKVGIILYCEYHVIMFPHPAQTFLAIFTPFGQNCQIFPAF